MEEIIAGKNQCGDMEGRGINMHSSNDLLLPMTFANLVLIALKLCCACARL